MIFFSAICILFPAIMGGLRQAGVGVDTMVYGLPHFLRASNASSFSDFLHSSHRMSVELGWAAVTYFSTKIFGVVQWNFFFYQLLTLTFTYIALYHYRDRAPMFFLWLIYLLGTYYTTYNIMRQSIAASIIFMGLPHLEAKRYKKFMVYVILAGLFHSSSLMAVTYFLIFHMLLTWKPKRTWLKTTILVGMFVMLAVARQLMLIAVRAVPSVSHLAYNAYDTYSLSRNMGLNIMLFGELFACLLYYNGMKRVFAHGEMYKLFTYNLAFQLAYTFTVQAAYIRMFYYFSYINVLLIATVPFFIKERTLRNLAFVSVFFVSAIFFCIVTYVKSSAGTWPYVSVLDL